jgi:hypothetical protein
VREGDGAGRFDGLGAGVLVNFVDSMGMLAILTPPLEIRNCFKSKEKTMIGT